MKRRNFLCHLIAGVTGATVANEAHALSVRPEPVEDEFYVGPPIPGDPVGVVAVEGEGATLVVGVRERETIHISRGGVLIGAHGDSITVHRGDTIQVCVVDSSVSVNGEFTHVKAQVY